MAKRLEVGRAVPGDGNGAAQPGQRAVAVVAGTSRESSWRRRAWARDAATAVIGSPHVSVTATQASTTAAANARSAAAGRAQALIAYA
jgi:hypothetical protein